MTTRTDELETELGRRVRDLRLAQGRTQDELARRANISTGALRHLESGSGANLRTLVRVLHALGEDGWIATLAPPAPAFSPLAALRAQQDEQQAATRQRRASRPRGPQ